MQLSTIFDLLKYGELKQLEISEDIDTTHSTEVLTHINLAMLNLYGKFPLSDKEIVVQTSMTKIIYELIPENTITNNPSNGFIIDTLEDPFTGDILRINSVFNHEGTEYSINDEHKVNSIFLPSYNSIQVPFADEVQRIYIIYRAKPKEIIIENGQVSSDVEVSLPEVLLEPLLKYVASRAHSTRTGDSALQESSILMKQYELMCNNIETKNILNNSINTANVKVEINGWR